MQKRGQSTPFIIAALLIIAAAILVTYVPRQLPLHEIPSAVTLPPHVEAVKAATQDCLDKVTADGIMLIFLQGGYNDPPREAAATSIGNIALWWHDAQRSQPAPQDIERELAAYAKRNILDCLDSTPLPEVTLRRSLLSVTATINEETTNVIANLQLEIEKNGLSTTLKDPFKTTIQLKGNRMYETAAAIVDSTIRDPKSINLGILMNSGLNIEVIPLENGITLYAITDTNAQVNNVPPTLMIAVETGSPATAP